MTDTHQTTPPMRLNVKVKVAASGDFHRFILTGSPGPDFGALNTKISEIAQKSFGVSGEDLEYKIFYVDDEDDLCVLASQDDLVCALSFLPTPNAPLRLTLEQLKPADKPSAAAPTEAKEEQQRQHSRRWYAVRGMTPPSPAERQPAWHKWATAKFGSHPARRLAAAWAISPGLAVKKLVAAMDGDLAAYQAVEAALAASAEQLPKQPEPTEGWGIHQAVHQCHPRDDDWGAADPHHHDQHHGWGKGLKGKGAGHMKGKHMHMKGKLKGMMLACELYGAPPPDMTGVDDGWADDGWGDWGTGKGKGKKSGHHGHGHHCGGRGGGGPAHKLAEALGIDKHQAWAILNSAAAGDPAAQAQLKAVLGEASEAKLDAEWMEAKLTKKAEKMAGKSEVLAQKAAWFAASDKEKDQKKAVKLREKAAKVEAKGHGFKKMAAGMLAGAPAPAAAEPPPPLAPAAEQQLPPPPAGAVEVVEVVDAAAAHPSMAAIKSVTVVAAPTAVEAVDALESPEAVNGGGGSEASGDAHESEDLEIELVAVDDADSGNAADNAADSDDTEAEVPPEWQPALENMTAMMGFPAQAALQALKDHNGNVHLAISTLIGA